MRVTASPAVTLVAIATVVCPTRVQSVPFADVYPVNTSPSRSSLSQAFGEGIRRRSAVAVEVVLERDAVLGRDGQQHVLAAGGGRFLDDDARLGPSIGVGLGSHPGDDRRRRR